MAHRKPLGTMFTSTFDWQGPHPALLDYLVSQADTWYRVVGVQEKTSPTKIGLTLERVGGPEGEVFRGPSGRCGVVEGVEVRLVHNFEWYPRHRRRAAELAR